MGYQPRLLKCGFVALLATIATIALHGQAAAQNGLTNEFFVNPGMGHGRMSMELASLDAQSASIGNPVPSPGSTAATGEEPGVGDVLSEDSSAGGIYNKLGGFSYSNPFAVPVVNINMKATASSLFGVGTLPISSRFSAFGKLGAVYTQLEADAVELLAYGNLTNKINFAWGLGAQYDFTSNTAVQLEFKNFGNVGNAPNFPAATGTGKSRLFFLGGLYRF